jgi:hypothetical protein
MTNKTLSKLRLPAVVVDGVIEFEYGGKLPLRDDARAEVVINTTDVMDSGFLDRMTRRRTVKLLPEGTVLLAMLSDPFGRGSFEVMIPGEPNGLWYPLKVFRDEKIADEENQIARAFWDDLKALLSPPAENG